MNRGAVAARCGGHGGAAPRALERPLRMGVVRAAAALCLRAALRASASLYARMRERRIVRLASSSFWAEIMSR